MVYQYIAGLLFHANILLISLAYCAKFGLSRKTYILEENIIDSQLRRATSSSMKREGLNWHAQPNEAELSTDANPPSVPAGKGGTEETKLHSTYGVCVPEYY